MGRSRALVGSSIRRLTISTNSQAAQKGPLASLLLKPRSSRGAATSSRRRRFRARWLALNSFSACDQWSRLSGAPRIRPFLNSLKIDFINSLLGRERRRSEGQNEGFAVDLGFSDAKIGVLEVHDQVDFQSIGSWMVSDADL